MGESPEYFIELSEKFTCSVDSDLNLAGMTTAAAVFAYARAPVFSAIDMC